MTVDHGKAVLIVLTNTKELQPAGDPTSNESRRTGYDVKEAALAYQYFQKTLGLEVNLASPSGGECTIDPSSLKASEHEEEVQAFLADPCAMQWTKCTDRMGAFDLGRFQAVVFVGGPGAMFDFAGRRVAQVVKDIWGRGGMVATIGHGAAALLSLWDEQGEPWIKNKKVTANTLEEDHDMRLEKMLPFSIQKRLEEVGAHFKKTEKFANNVVVDGRLVTAQNRNSTRDWLQQIDSLLQK
ncbi:DJ-1/PfpI family protein [Paramicrosporidium saccamoebae]|uniref:D-lactate dehydratase n=1 Tax=Paramicrosporidium saccamoebae TaxID=1246581 RepID=A0A2H9TK30_9FUNG|nr:DJ-1/PfpI family protein [Paramicrosporidium saccamoebae]